MRRAKHTGGKDSSERWLLTYADLITLLMIFFVVMFAISKADADKVGRVAESLKAALGSGVLRGSVAPMPTDAKSGSGSMGVLDPEIITRRDLDLAAIKERVEAHSQQEGFAGLVTARSSMEGIVVTVSGNLLFDSGKASLKDVSASFLDMMAATLAAMPNQVRVEGHTDNIPFKNELYASNWELSSARANAVVRYLEAAGVDPVRLSSVGYGEFRPLVDNDTRENRALNRRVELLIQY